MTAVLRAARSAVARRRLQTFIVAAVVLLSTATGMIALGLLVVSHGPFDRAFAHAQGAHTAVSIAAATPNAAITATASGSGVTGSAGPFDVVSAGISAASAPSIGIGTIVGRSDQGGAVDRLSLDSGAWLSGPGQIVLSREYAGPLVDRLGSQLTIGVPGSPALKLVGIADSVTGTADAWVWPGQSDVLHASGAPTAKQMLYRFSSHGTVDALRASLATATASLPKGAVTGSSNYLSARIAANRNIAAFVPFVVAFAILGIVLSVLIATNVVNGAVVSGYRTIGVLKTLGFTPRQVVTVYVLQVLAPAAVGTVLGGVLGVVLALPLLGDTDRAYDLPDSSAGIPLWIMVVVPVAALALVALAAFGPALRAGRLAANQAISIGRAPRAGRGFRLRRLLTASRLPRSVALGAGMPLARPARAAGTVVALILGAVTLVFAVGLTSSLDRIHTAFSRVSTVPVTIPGFLMFTPNGPSDPQPQSKEPAAIADLARVQRIVDAQPGTAHSVIVRDVGVHVSGFNQPVTVEAYDGDARWTGFAMISGRWYAGPDEVVASSYLLRQSGFDVGDHLTVVGDQGTRVVTVVGDFMDGGDNYDLVAAAGTVAGISTVANGPESRTTIEIGLKPGTNATTYATALQAKFPDSSGVFVDNRTATNSETTFLILDALITTLTVLLCSVAALGVLNTVVLNTRERVHDIGVLKSLGMTPRQVRGMIITSMVGLGVIGALVAVPLGVLLHHYILPTMAAAAGTGVAPSIVDVYHPVQLIVLGVAGVALAVVGALLPAGWAARTRVSNALRAE